MPLSNATPTQVKPAPPAQRSAPPPAAVPAPAAVAAPVATSSVSAGNQWARGPPRAKQPEEPAPEPPAPVVVPQQQQTIQEQPDRAAAPGKAWGNAGKSKSIVSEAKAAAPDPAPVQAKENDHPSTLPEQALTQQQAAATQPAIQEQYRQHSDPTASMASLDLGQSTTAPTSSAPFADGYNNGVQQDASFDAANMYYSSQSNAGKTGTRHAGQASVQQIPQMSNVSGSMSAGSDANGPTMTWTQMQMYSNGFDASGAATKLTSSFGMEQDSSVPAGQNSQSLLLQQHTW